MNHIKVFIHHSTIPPFLFLSSLTFFFLLFILPSIYPTIRLSFHGPSFRPSIFLSITLSPSFSSTSPSSFHHPNISLYIHPRLSIHPSIMPYPYVLTSNIYPSILSFSCLSFFHPHSFSVSIHSPFFCLTSIHPFNQLFFPPFFHLFAIFSLNQYVH